MPLSVFFAYFMYANFCLPFIEFNWPDARAVKGIDSNQLDRHLLGFACAGSNPALVDIIFLLLCRTTTAERRGEVMERSQSMRPTTRGGMFFFFCLA